MVTQAKIGGRNVPSVSQIIGIIANPKIDEWKERVGLVEARRIKKEGAAFGQAIHSDFQRMFTTGEITSTGEKELSYLGSLLEWGKQKVSKWICFEHNAFNDSLPYCARIDAVAELKTGETVIIDLKTSKYNADTYDLQMSAYLHCNRFDRYIVDPTVITRGILLFPRATSCEEISISQDSKSWDIFQAAYNIWKWRTSKTEQFQLKA